MRSIEGIEELKTLVGQELGASDWFEMKQSTIDAFAEITHDPQWIHVDAERARRESPYGTTVAHGFLTLSLISHLLHQTIEVRGNFRMTVNYGLNRVRFPAPVLAGSRIRLRTRLESVKEVEGGFENVWGVQVEMEGATKPSLVAEWVTRVYC